MLTVFGEAAEPGALNVTVPPVPVMWLTVTCVDFPGFSVPLGTLNVYPCPSSDALQVSGCPPEFATVNG